MIRRPTLPPAERTRSLPAAGWRWCALLALLFAAGCDSVAPDEPGLLVVEGFVDSGRALPVLVLRETARVTDAYPDDASTAIADAEVAVSVDGSAVRYEPLPGMPGRYGPVGEAAHAMAPEGARFELDVRWRDQRARASTVAPRVIRIDSLAVHYPDEPVEAVILDSLAFADSLAVPVATGYIYPVEVTLWWDAGPEEGEASWIQTRLRPRKAFSSPIVNFVLRPEEVFREDALRGNADRRRRWTGIYAVPVGAADSPMPAHQLKIALVRSGTDYARFASSRDAPERREPVTNVEGAIGIFAGVSVDSVTVRIE